MPVAKGQRGVAQEMRKFSKGRLHSGSAKGPIVTNPAQAKAIAMSEAGLSKNPGSIANKDPRGAHGGFPAPTVGQRRSQPAPRSAGAIGRVPPLAGPRANAAPHRNPSRLAAGGAPATAMYGGPPADGFHRVTPPAGTAVPSQHKKYEHLGRFSTGTPRKGVSKHTRVPAIANL